MTKEELEKEAEEYTKNLLKKLGIKEDMLLENQPKYLRQESINFVALDVENVTEAYLVGAKPREKRIKHLEDSLLDVTEKSVKKIADLEAQIEKMKCCGNCDVGDKACYVRTQEYVNICPSWKLKEIKGKWQKLNLNIKA